MRPPVVFHIRFVLWGWADPVFYRNEPMLLIESTRWSILLMGMQFESNRAALHCVFEQRRSNPTVLMVRTDIEAIDIARLQRQVADDTVRGFCHPHFAAGGDRFAKHVTGL